MNQKPTPNALRTTEIPAIEKLLNTSEMLELQATYARPLVVEAPSRCRR